MTTLQQPTTTWDNLGQPGTIFSSPYDKKLCFEHVEKINYSILSIFTPINPHKNSKYVCPESIRWVGDNRVSTHFKHINFHIKRHKPTVGGSSSLKKPPHPYNPYKASLTHATLLLRLLQQTATRGL